MTAAGHGDHEVIRSTCEKERQIEALTAVVASQHAEIVRCHERINELLRSNNEFEERARQAERKVKALANYRP